MIYRIFGLAKGVRSTAGAARGAFTYREYATKHAYQEGLKDWQFIQYQEKARS